MIGFDGIAFTNYVNPRLATVRQDIQYMATRPELRAHRSVVCSIS